MFVVAANPCTCRCKCGCRVCTSMVSTVTELAIIPGMLSTVSGCDIVTPVFVMMARVHTGGPSSSKGAFTSLSSVHLVFASCVCTLCLQRLFVG